MKKYSSSKNCYASLTYKRKKYDLIFSHPLHMLMDNTLSWESKGYLSYLAFIEDENKVELSLFVINELIHNGYLVEVEE